MRPHDQDPALRQKLRSLAALSFLPPNEVAEAFEDLHEEMPQECADLLSYFEDSYVGRMRRNRRMDPIFRIDIWNNHERVMNDLPRTTNAVEGWHCAFGKACGGSHLNLFKFIGVLKREQSLNEVKIAQLLAGGAPPRRQKKYCDLDQRIKTLVQRYAAGDLGRSDFLRGVSYNVHY